MMQKVTPQERRRKRVLNSPFVRVFGKIEKPIGIASIVMGLGGLAFALLSGPEPEPPSPKSPAELLSEILEANPITTKDPWPAEVLEINAQGMRVLSGKSWRWVEYEPGVFRPDPNNPRATAMGGGPVLASDIKAAKAALAASILSVPQVGLWCLQAMTAITSNRVVCAEKTNAI